MRLEQTECEKCTNSMLPSEGLTDLCRLCEAAHNLVLDTPVGGITTLREIEELKKYTPEENLRRLLNDLDGPFINRDHNDTTREADWDFGGLEEEYYNYRFAVDEEVDRAFETVLDKYKRTLNALNMSEFEQHPVPKVPLDLNPPEAIEAMALAFQDGANKYGAHDWELNGFDTNERLAAIMRHALALLSGQSHAPDSGLHHGAHLLADAAMIYTQYVRQTYRHNKDIPPLTQEYIGNRFNSLEDEEIWDDIEAEREYDELCKKEEESDVHSEEVISGEYEPSLDTTAKRVERFTV